MKKILVPVDFSDHSEYALRAAASIAKKQGAELIALHMIGISEAVISKGDAPDAQALVYLKLAERRFEEFLEKDYLKGISVTDTVYNYKNFSEIHDVAEDHKVDLIVMGSHGSSGFSEVFVGSNTEKVVRTSEVPVLVIKHDTTDFKLNNIVFACDFEEESLTAYRKAAQFFDKMDVKVHLLHVNLPNEKFRSTSETEETVRNFMNKATGEATIKNVAFINDYTVEDGIFSYSNQVNADAIAVATHGRKGLAHFFLGSVGEDLANHSDIPVITFKI